VSDTAGLLPPMEAIHERQTRNQRERDLLRALPQAGDAPRPRHDHRGPPRGPTAGPWARGPAVTTTPTAVPAAERAPAVPLHERLTWGLDDIAALTGLSRRSLERSRSAGRLPRPDLTCGRRVV
jgi:hypothetical protein